MQSKVHEERQKNEAYIDELKKKIAILESKMKEVEHEKVRVLFLKILLYEVYAREGREGDQCDNYGGMRL